jgi:vacuolar-type H+-ATPase subunit H
MSLNKITESWPEAMTEKEIRSKEVEEKTTSILKEAQASMRKGNFAFESEIPEEKREFFKELSKELQKKSYEAKVLSVEGAHLYTNMIRYKWIIKQGK